MSQHDLSPRSHHENLFHIIILIDLYWLLVTRQCQYRLKVLTYNPLHGTTPVYRCDMLNWYHPDGPLRSGAFPLLTPNSQNTIMYGSRLCGTVVLLQQLSKTICQSTLDPLFIYKRQSKSHLFLNLSIY